MSTASADQYLAVVESELSDLPWKARKSLLADLRLHLDEIPPDEDLEERLGSPWNYATELREAADLRPRRGPIAFLRARRPRNVAIAALLLALIGAITAGGLWSRSYQPLSEGGAEMFPLNARGPAALEGRVATFRSGKPFQVGASVRNDGHFPVRILGVPIIQGRFTPFAVRPYLGPAENNCIGAMCAETFHPFTLEPGKERLIMLLGHYANCRQFHQGNGTGLESIPIRMKFLLSTRTVYVPLRGPLEIEFPMRDPCAS